MNRSLPASLQPVQRRSGTGNARSVAVKLFTKIPELMRLVPPYVVPPSLFEHPPGRGDGPGRSVRRASGAGAPTRQGSCPSRDFLRDPGDPRAGEVLLQ